MALKDVALKKALKSKCDKCKLLRRCSDEMSFACIDSFTKGFMSGYKYKQIKNKKA